MIVVLDSCALIAYFKKEPGGLAVDSLLNDPTCKCFIHAINLCEVYYELYGLVGERGARMGITRVIEAGVIVPEDLDIAFWQQVGRYKATLKRVSLADCFCMTLANILGVEIVTTDRHEFEPLAQQGICRARFVR